MVALLVIVVLVLIVCFGGVLLFGAPYLPTLSPQVSAALELAEAKSGQTLLELGCGDGKVLLAAAKAGLKATGYELNPLLAGVAWLRTRRYRRQIKVVCGNFWQQQWPDADILFTFLLPKYMKKLDTKIAAYPHHPVTLISFAFAIPDRPPTAEKQGVFRYDYL